MISGNVSFSNFATVGYVETNLLFDMPADAELQFL